MDAHSTSLTNLLRTPADPRPSMKKSFGPMLVIALAMIIRLAAMLVLESSILNQPSQDPDGYGRFAHHLARDGVYGETTKKPSAYRPPIYPILLLPWYWRVPPLSWGICVLHLLAAALTVSLTWRLAELVGTGRWAWLAALIVAVDPLLIWQSTLLMTETVFAAIFAGILLYSIVLFGPAGDLEPTWRLIWRRRFLTGLLLAIGGLTRPIAWAYWAVMILVAARQHRMRDWGWTTLLVIVFISPWLIRNHLALDHWVPATTHGGYSLWLGQNPVYYAQVVAGPNSTWPQESFQHWTAENIEWTAEMSETERDSFYHGQAVDWMIANPTHALRSVLHHVWSLWRPAPRKQNPMVVWLCGAFHFGLYLLAAFGLTRRSLWQNAGLALPVSMISFTVVHAFYWSNIRMRAPLIPVLAILAAHGFEMLMSCFRPKDRLESRL